MKLVSKVLLTIFCFVLLAISTFAQSGQVVIYTGANFTGVNMPLSGNWSGGSLSGLIFERRIKSIRVPSGFKVRMYAEKNFKGTETMITEDWDPGSGAWWTTKIRSIRVERAQIQPPSSGDFPVIYAQANYSGPAEAIERGFAGHSDWEGSPHRIRSIRVPAGWKLTLYTERNYRGTETTITSSISWESGAYWNGRVRSIRAERTNVTPPTHGDPVIYAQVNFNGPAMAIVKDWAELRDWDGSPHHIRSIRVPQGRPINGLREEKFRRQILYRDFRLGSAAGRLVVWQNPFDQGQSRTAAEIG